jgi:hypothetical protein
MIWSPPIFETKTCWWSLGLIGEAARRMTEQTSVLMLAEGPQNTFTSTKADKR